MAGDVLQPTAHIDEHHLLRFGHQLQDLGVEHLPDELLKFSPGEYSNWNFDSARALNTGLMMLEAGRIAVLDGLYNYQSFDAIASCTAAGAALSFGMGFDANRQISLNHANLDQTDRPISQDPKSGYGLHGPAVDGREVIAVAGSGFTGLYLAQLIEMIRKNGGSVTDALVMVDRSQGRAVQNLGRIGVNYRYLYEMDEQTGELWPSYQLPGEFPRIKPADATQVLEAILDAGVFKIKRSGTWKFAGGQHSNNKLDMEEAYQDPRALRLIMQALGRLALPYDADLIVPVADGANQLGVLLGVHLDLPVAFLQKDKVEPGLKTFKYRTDKDKKLVERSKRLIVVEDVPNQLTSIHGVLQVLGIGERAIAALGVFNRGLPGKAIDLSIPLKAILNYPISNQVAPDHQLYGRAVMLSE